MKNKLQLFISELNVAETDRQTFDTVGDLGFQMCNDLHTIALRIEFFIKEKHAKT